MRLLNVSRYNASSLLMRFSVQQRQKISVTLRSEEGLLALCGYYTYEVREISVQVGLETSEVCHKLGGKTAVRIL